MNAIYNKELKQFFVTPMGYIFVAFMVLVFGIYALAINFVQASPNFEYTVYNCTIVYLLLIPVLTMRSLAEEKRQRTEQLLFSAPVSITDIVVGKFVALFTIIMIPVLIAAFIPIIMSMYGTVNYIAAYNALVQYALLGGALCAIGMFISSFTDNQLVAAVISLIAMFILYYLPSLLNLISTNSMISVIVFAVVALLLGVMVYGMTKNVVIALATAAVIIVALAAVYFTNSLLFEGAITTVLSGLCVFTKLMNSYYGIVDITAYVYYISVIALFLFFTVQSIEQRRWN